MTITCCVAFVWTITVVAILLLVIRPETANGQNVVDEIVKRDREAKNLYARVLNTVASLYKLSRKGLVPVTIATMFLFLSACCVQLNIEVVKEILVVVERMLIHIFDSIRR